MIILVTGKPGVGKTNLTLTEFLAIKDRPKYAAGIKDFDYAANGVTEISHFSDWTKCPDGSVIFIDEVQRDLRSQAKAGDLPQWVTDLETHRHKGIDIYLTTQFPAFVHIHVRRLVEEHRHFHRAAGAGVIVKRVWTSCVDDPNASNNITPQAGCTVTLVRLNKDTFQQYTSTVLDTHKFKFPVKLFTYGLVVIGLLIGAIYIGYPVFKQFTDKAGHLNEVGNQGTTVVPANTNAPAQQPQTQIQSGPFGAPVHKLTIDDFTPVNDVMPWSAPFYAAKAQPIDIPVLTGCIERTGDKPADYYCTCYTQQGTKLMVDGDICRAVVNHGAYPFNPFRTQMLAQQQNSSQQTAAVPAQAL